MAIIVDKDGNVVTVENEPEEARAMFPNLQDGIQDIIINGESIVLNGVAYIPIASASVFGVVKIGNGIMILDGAIRTDPALDNDIKVAADQFKPIAPLKQHRAVFYGLAKAAGDTTQALSSNQVGNYTDEAKIAIQKMLGIYEAPWELIREDSGTNVSEANIEITADSNSQAFELTDIRLIFNTPVQETLASVGGSGRIKCFYSNFESDNMYIGAYTQEANASAKTGAAELLQSHGMIKRNSWSNITNNGARAATNVLDYLLSSTGVWQLAQKTYTKISIESVTGAWRYKLYGKRKWQ